MWGGCGREFFGEGGCGVGGWFLGGGWLRFGEEWGRNEKVFGRSLRVFLAKIGADFARKEVLSPLPVPLASEGCALVRSAARESEEIKEIRREWSVLYFVRPRGP